MCEKVIFFENVWENITRKPFGKKTIRPRIGEKTVSKVPI
jgi:hypothetical protein